MNPKIGAIRIRPALLFTSLIVAVATASADPITSSASCAIVGQPAILSSDSSGLGFSSSSCSGSLDPGPNAGVGGPGVYGYNANTQASYYFGSDNTLFVSLSSETYIQGGVAADVVSSMASLDLNLYSESYVGTAYVEFSGDIVRDFGDDTDVFQMTPGFGSDVCGVYYGTYCVIPVSYGPNGSIPAPVQLQLGGGNLFNFYAAVGSTASGFYQNNLASVNGTLSFYQADGVTPLEITLAPEPTSVGIVCLGLWLCGMAVMKRPRVN